VQHSKAVLAKFEQRLRQNNENPDKQRFSESFIQELHSWQEPLQKALQQSFLKEVGPFSGLSHESLVLQQKTGYSSIYRIWQELKFYLDMFANDVAISIRAVSEIYEIWCFLKIKQILVEELGFVLDESKLSGLKVNKLFEYQLKDGFAGAFKFKRSDNVTASLAHEPVFNENTKALKSYTTSQKPDIVLKISIPSHDYGSNGRNHPGNTSCESAHGSSK